MQGGLDEAEDVFGSVDGPLLGLVRKIPRVRVLLVQAWLSLSLSNQWQLATRSAWLRDVRGFKVLAAKLLPMLFLNCLCSDEAAIGGPQLC